MTVDVLLYVIVFLYGIIIGSFLNVLIYRIPKKENFITSRSHCMNCEYQLKWYDLIPVFSYVFLGGKCRKCRTHISLQYPLIELLNGSMYLVITLIYGVSLETLLYALLFSALLALSVIDFRTFEIPLGFNIFIFCLGVIRVITDFAHWSDYVIGFFVVSGFIYLIILLTKGRGMGDGDGKLMAAVGLLIGWKLVLLSFFLGCVFGSILHIARMKITRVDHVLAFGPYLSMGIMVSVLWGTRLIDWYIDYFL